MSEGLSFRSNAALGDHHYLCLDCLKFKVFHFYATPRNIKCSQDYSWGKRKKARASVLWRVMLFLRQLLTLISGTSNFITVPVGACD